MSIEERIKKRGNQKLNKYAKNPYHVSWVDRMPLWSKIVVPASLLVASSAALVVVLTLPKNVKNNSESSNSISVAPSIAPSSIAHSAQESLYSVPKWEDRAINDQYRVLSFNSITYYSYLYPMIEEEYIGVLIDENITLSGSEEYFENNNYSPIMHETSVKLYKINGFNPNFILAVKFIEDNGYYWYKNVSNVNRYLTLGEFLDNVDINEVATFPTGFYECQEGNERHRYKYEGIDKTQIMNCIFNNVSAYFAKEVEDKIYSQYSNYISIPIYMPRLHLNSSGINGASGLSFYDNGFLEITFLNKKDLFYIGEEHYQTLKDYMVNNLVGEELPIDCQTINEEGKPSSNTSPSSTTLP